MESSRCEEDEAGITMDLGLRRLLTQCSDTIISNAASLLVL